jgi:protein-S-isoprenylcysteine O-methyltransferase Ste14
MHWLIVVAAIILTAIWIANGICIVQGIRTHITSQALTHTGLAVFFSVPVLELTVGTTGLWPRYESDLMQIIGFILYAVGASLVGASFHALATKGMAARKDITATKALVETGIYGIVRQPMMLGTTIWSVGMILVFRSVVSLCMGGVAIVLFYLASVTEARYNAGKFGQVYRDYAARVPIWNVFAGLRRARTRQR